MSFVVAVPETLSGASTVVNDIGSALIHAHTAAAVHTTGFR
jgi:hypothetical protein